MLTGLGSLDIDKSYQVVGGIRLLPGHPDHFAWNDQAIQKLERCESMARGVVDLPGPYKNLR